MTGELRADGAAMNPGRAARPEPAVERGAGTGSVPAAAGELTPWQQYVLLLRQLDAERAAEQARTAAHREAAQSVVSTLERLGPRVIEQGGELSELATRLGLHRPRLAALPPAAEVAPDQVARATQEALDRADAAARAAAELGQRAAFLPRWPARARNAVIYLAWALAALLVQGYMIRDGSGSGLLVLIVIPLVTFLGALVMVGTLGRIRLSARKPERSARMGALICFGLFPLGVIYLVLHG